MTGAIGRSDQNQAQARHHEVCFSLPSVNIHRCAVIIYLLAVWHILRPKVSPDAPLSKPVRKQIHRDLSLELSLACRLGFAHLYLIGSSLRLSSGNMVSLFAS